MRSLIELGGSHRTMALALTGVLVSGIVLLTAGCGAEKQTVTAPAAVNNTPPGGGSAEEYSRMMQKNRGTQGGGGGSGFPSGGPGGPRGAAPASR